MSPLRRIMWIILGLVLAAGSTDGSWGCQLPHDWRPQTEACRAELAEIIVFAKVLALHKESYSVYNYLPWQHDTDLLFSAEIELLCDQSWGSMLEVPAGSRFNVSGLGYLPCFSYSVTENNNYYFFLRMDENYNIIPHGVNFQDPIFPDTPENHRMFASLFQFSNCTPGTQVHSFTPEWEAQEDSR
ncbi:Coiled-coil domain-containing protein 3, partial [Ataeniobius toweri]|nr:Coiled-coil domain-containing protein 3 [Ataeniobius toweri]